MLFAVSISSQVLTTHCGPALQKFGHILLCKDDMHVSSKILPTLCWLWNSPYCRSESYGGNMRHSVMFNLRVHKERRAKRLHALWGDLGWIALIASDKSLDVANATGRGAIVELVVCRELKPGSGERLWCLSGADVASGRVNVLSGPEAHVGGRC